MKTLYSLIIIFTLTISTFSLSSGIIDSTGITGEKPQSKCWFAHNFWWIASGGKIFRQADNKFIKVQNIPENNARIDALWNGNELFFISTHKHTQHFYKYIYNSTDTSYTLLDGFPIVFSESNNLTLGKLETIVITQDTLGKIWATYEDSLDIHVIWTTSKDHKEWNTKGYIIGRNVKADDISSIVRLPNSRIGVLWSNQRDNKFHFRYHNANDADTLWSKDEIALNNTDDHINFAVTPDGRIYVAVKTHKPMLIARDTLGNWTSYEKPSEGGTRPIVMYNSVDDEILFYSSVAEGTSPLVCYRMPCDNIVLANPDTIISFADTKNPSGTKQILTEESGALIITQKLNNQYTKSAYFHFLDLNKSFLRKFLDFLF